MPGLRREEIALLAGMSVDYYNRFERGNVAGASEPVLDALARALRLDAAERQHLFDLARAASAGAGPRRRRAPVKLPQGVQHLLDAMTGVPAFVRNGRLDILAMNDLSRELYHPGGVTPPAAENFARYLFLDPAARTALERWEDMAEDSVAILRQEAGRAPHSRELADLVGELSVGSDDFRRMWAVHDVRFHHSGVKQFHHPDVGDLELSFQALELSGLDGLTLIAYYAEPGTPAHDALALLTAISATHRHEPSDASTPAGLTAGARADSE